MKRTIERARRFLRHGRETVCQYRAECYCGWVGPWCKDQYDSDMAWEQHKRVASSGDSPSGETINRRSPAGPQKEPTTREH